MTQISTPGAGRAALDAYPSPDACSPGDAGAVRGADPSRDEGAPHQISQFQRVVTLIVMLVPLAGLVAAMAYAWGWGFGWVELGLLLGMYVLTGLGVTVGYHRLFTHKSFETGRVLTAVFGILGSMSVEGPVLRWVAFHRKHHQHSDRPGDPHSPHEHGEGVWATLKGFVSAHMGWMMRASDVDVGRYVVDLRKRRLVRVVSALFPVWVLLSMLLPALIGGLVTLSWSGALLGFLWGGLVRILLVHHVTWSVNSVCHLWGTRPFKSHDESRNNPIVGVLAFGEGWHNNHHAFPTSARHGLRWWEIDTSYLVIWTLAKLGLVWNVRVPAPERVIAKRA
ncbi:MAG TPA: acyl-CoA desaturase [Phycisphaerales bacterium]|nr:acyl-CoA desaturase [Phycisphaerales bacterium]